MTTETSISRRGWLKKIGLYGLVATTLGTLGGILADVWLAAGRFTTSHWDLVTGVEEIATNATVLFPGHRLAVIRRGNRIGALSLECSHLGCLVNAVDQGFFCPCHGSEFGPLGEVYSGPAPTSLPWYPLQIRQGKLWVHTGRRLAEPVWVNVDGDNSGRSGANHGHA